MEKKIKNIVARFIKIPVEQINGHTIIDRSAIGSSILLHRMYGALANEGIVVENYLDIKDYGTLIRRMSGTVPTEMIVPIATTTDFGNAPTFARLGIDMEKIASMPQVADFREDAFYKMNFAPSEIAYCILQSNPLASFAGLFAAKEALVKADNVYKGYAFNSIIIDHLPSGKPIHQSFLLSISHTDELAIAVAMRDHSAVTSQVTSPSTQQSSLTFWLAIFALLFSSVAILFIFFNNSIR